MSSAAAVLWLSKINLGDMALPKKFAVVKLKEVASPNQNPYKCVPKTWLQFQTPDDVMLPYPTVEELPFSIDLMINYAPPLISWPRYPVSFVCELDTFKQGIFLIRHMDEALSEEHAIMVWREVSREFKERQSRQQPISVVRQLWNWFSSFLYQ